ncbi:ATP-dependent nuclease [Candidatus Manganitrophus noduliformans]|uniref:AAA family ATPase n=1 Tax=Candidatus Manganitrophus noduliformans TaxID=2606439 RepID=A0A7X6IDS8_9BACT|nr:ATP-binding protein [Candidatus Manganitrophus noduliformans]NKE73731.1 AAA family ATPase [Candidatus Manganitrophus noduliformans]
MRIVFVEIRNFRGIKELDWAPAPTVNCLIGPGDSTKTAILDAVELALNPRYYQFADDSDFFDLNVNNSINITVTLAGLPSKFKSDDRYGMYLRGWNDQESKVYDEPGEGLEDALSVRVMIDDSLEARWSIFNDRIEAGENDPPTVRHKDFRELATTRLGPYAERHLGWGRQSVLSRMGEATESINLQLAQANRAARDAFRQGNQEVFKETVSRAEQLGRQVSVPVRDKYVAELDVQGVSITSGGIALHDGKLPLRRLGTGSSRLIVSALQHDSGGSHIALIDEIEHGLEPHRIARLIKYIKSPPIGDTKVSASQIFVTTHSPVVIRELIARDIFTVRCEVGLTKVRSVLATTEDLNTVQRHLRATPEAFLARRILVGEGRTEQGFLRGLDAWWSQKGRDSFALQGTIAVDGCGANAALGFAEHLLDLGYKIALLLDTDKPLPTDLIDAVKNKGGVIFEWPGTCSIEERIFLDVPWKTVISIVKFAEELHGADSVKDNINNACKAQSLSQISDLSFSEDLDTDEFRRVLGKSAKNKDTKRSWFKDVSRGEELAEIIAPCLDQILDKPLAITLSMVRQWVDG